MRCAITLEARFLKTSDGAFWSEGTFAYKFWERYLSVFEDVLVVARAKDVKTPLVGYKRVDGPNVSVMPVPYYLGPVQFVRKALEVKRTVQQAIENDNAVIMRVGSTLATMLEPRLRANNKPYGVEVVGDPFDVFAPGAVKHPLRPFFRWWAPRALRRQCKNASAAAYVTQCTLQKRYPPAPGVFTTFYSNVELPDEIICTSPRIGKYSGNRPVRIITIGSLAQLYKAPDILIDAIGVCLREGVNAELVLIGDGKYRNELEEKAASLGIGDRVKFLGYIPSGQPVRNQLDKGDLFILPSLTEGLPRAMIEAMARALPCIGSTAGGIPELLDSKDMVLPGDVRALAAKICEVLSDPQRLMKMSERNLMKAREYGNSILKGRREEFYTEVRNRTFDWLNISNGSVRHF